MSISSSNVQRLSNWDLINDFSGKYDVLDEGHLETMRCFDVRFRWKLEGVRMLNANFRPRRIPTASGSVCLFIGGRCIHRGFAGGIGSNSDTPGSSVFGFTFGLSSSLDFSGLSRHFVI
jgi:hypothetical protein